jgi:hypothetical protein
MTPTIENSDALGKFPPHDQGLVFHDHFLIDVHVILIQYPSNTHVKLHQHTMYTKDLPSLLLSASSM